MKAREAKWVAGRSAHPEEEAEAEAEVLEVLVESLLPLLEVSDWILSDLVPSEVLFEVFSNHSDHFAWQVTCGSCEHFSLEARPVRLDRLGADLWFVQTMAWVLKPIEPEPLPSYLHIEAQVAPEQCIDTETRPPLEMPPLDPLNVVVVRTSHHCQNGPPDRPQGRCWEELSGPMYHPPWQNQSWAG